MAPLYGKRLMPTVVDDIAEQTPNLTYASVPISANINDGFKAITFSDIASATNRVAAWIDSQLGRSSKFDTIAYMGPGDLRYVVVFLAAVKCGYKVLLPSLRNSPWMNISLFEQTECTHLLFAPDIDHFVKPLLSEKPDLNIHPIQPLEYLVVSDTPHYAYEKNYDSAKWDPILILHSSGSTGPPRPIVMNHNTFAVGDNDRNLPIIPGRVNQNWSLWDFPEKEAFFSPFPAFHLAGFSSMVMLPIYYSNATLILPPATRPPSGHLVSEIMDHFELKSIFCPPIIAEQLVQEPLGLEKCKSLKFLLYAGGPLSQAAGEALSKVTDVCQFYGQTETGAIQALVPRQEDWASLEWHPMQEAIMEPSIDGTYEMIMKRNPALEGVRNVTCNFPDVEIWRTRDLFKPHPSKKGLWKFHGRADDIVVLSNGEKFNPVPSETHIASHPLLGGALIIGQGYPQASLVLEVKDCEKFAKKVIEQVWPTIEEANKQAPTHARITRGMIVIGTQDKPFDRAAKGTIIRKSSGAKYEKEISDLYAKDVTDNVKHITLCSSPDFSATKEFVTEVIHTAFSGHKPSENEDLFVNGLDSLQTAEITTLLKAGIKSHMEGKVSWITAKFIYDHPTISSLSLAVFNRVVPATHAIETSQETSARRPHKLSGLVGKYTQDFPPPQEKTSSPNLHVILTGATGSLGTQLLVKLLTDPTISRVSCFDRSENAHDRIIRSLSSWSPPPIVDPSRVSFHSADYSRPDFGLGAEVYEELQKSVNVIIHNAWKVDFNHSIDSFEGVHIRGVRNFIDFAASNSLATRIIFISSISSVGNWTSAGSQDEITVVPETIPPNPAVAQPIGYAESKAVSEQVLAKAAVSCGIKVSIVRVGQIAGPISEKNGGYWNEHEWFPLLLKSSKAIRKLPDRDTLDNIDWIPIDILSAVISEIITISSPRTLQIYHAVNPTTTTWAELLPYIQGQIGVQDIISLQEWVEELEKVDLSDRDAVAQVPAVKILDFFKEMVNSKYIGAKHIRYSTSAAQASSPSLKALRPVNEEWINKWIKDWGF